MNTTDAKKVIAVLKVHAPNHPTPPQIADVWAMALDDVPLDAVMFAVKHWIRHNKWFPTPVEIRDLVSELVCGIPGANDAWRQVEQAVRRNYPGLPVKYTLDGLVLEAAREIGGVHAIRNARDEREFGELRKRFTARYEQMRRERMQIADIAGDWQVLQAGESSNLRVLPNRSAS